MNGLKKLWTMKVFISTIALLTMTSTMTWSAQTSSNENLNSSQQEEQNPDGELLEFLGLFEDEETGWVDPMYLLETDDDVIDGKRAKEEKDETR
jgi:hypothetical protein